MHGTKHLRIVGESGEPGESGERGGGSDGLQNLSDEELASLARYYEGEK